MISLLLAIIYISFISLGLPDSLLGSAWPSMYGSLNVPVSYAGIISMIITGCTIISSLSSDRLVRKLGTGLVTAISVGMTAAALFGFSVSHSFIQLCIWAIPYGLGAGSVDAALNNFVALHYKARHMNWLHCFWGVGATIGPYIMGACLTRSGWNSGYRIISFIQIALASLLLISLPLWKKKSDDASIPAEKSNAKDIPSDTSQQESSSPAKSIHLSPIQLLSLPQAKQILAAFFCYCSLESTTGLWGAVYMVIKKGISTESAAKFIALFYLGITAGRFISGFLSVKLSSKSMIRLGQIFAACGIVIIIISANQFATAAGFMIIGLGCAPIYPALLHQTPERFGANVSQSIMGMQMACAYIGSTLTPPVTGFIVSHISVSLYPLILLAIVALMAVLVEYCNKKSGSQKKI